MYSIYFIKKIYRAVFLMLHIKNYPELIIPNYKKDINTTNKRGWTPLSLACANNASVECIECLLLLGADPNITTDDLCSPLMITAAFHTDKSYDILQLLIKYGANQNLLCKEGWNASMFACRDGNVKTVSLLINCHNINNTTPLGNTPLMLASNNKNHAISIIKFLLDSGADINKLTLVKKVFTMAKIKILLI